MYPKYPTNELKVFRGLCALKDAQKPQQIQLILSEVVQNFVFLRNAVSKTELLIRTSERMD